MASSGGTHLPTFEEIIKRGSLDPGHTRPVPKIHNGNPAADLSLSGAVKAADHSDKKNGISISEPKKRVRNKVRHEESGFSSEGSPSQTRRRTPMTMPRTKVTSATPLEQRIALKRLKQKLDFEQQGEERKPDENRTKVSIKNPSLLNGVTPMDDISVSSASEYCASEFSEFDDTKIADRLNQVREYLKQATSMYVNLSIEGSSEPKKVDQMNKLAKLIQQLRIQEQGYLDLLQKTLDMAETHSNMETVSAVSTDQQSVQSIVDEQYLHTDVVKQQQELGHLREQQALLTKIVQQQKELKELKERQTSLLQMQENAEKVINGQRMLNNVPNNQRAGQPEEHKPKNVNNNEPRQSAYIAEEQVSSMADPDEVGDFDSARRAHLESKLQALQEKKEQMDQLMVTLKALKNAQTAEEDMISKLNQDSSSLTEVNPSNDDDLKDQSDDNMDVSERIDRLNEVRGRLHELRSIVADYETGNTTSPHTTDVSRDNRLHAQAIQQKQGNTITGKGGAKLRLPNQDFLLNDLQTLQNGIEELMDNRNRPAPPVQQRIEVTRNSSSTIKTKNTNQEKKQQKVGKNGTKFSKNLSADYLKKMGELQLARSRIADEHNYFDFDKDSASLKTVTTQTEEESESGKDSDVESTASSTLQWQDDPEFQNKVIKLQMAREKLHQLQQLVKVVQESGGPQLPVDDLIDLTLTISGDENETSACGESEEEADEEDAEIGDEDQSDDEDADGEQTEDDNLDGESVASKSTDLNYNFAPENGLSDNERRYQGLLRKQRLELNYLLKERERLLEAQQKISALAPTAVSAHTQTNTSNVASSRKVKIDVSAKPKTYPSLTKAELNKQDKYKQQPKKSLFSKLDGMSVEPHYGSENDIFPPSIKSDKGSMTVPYSNPMAVSEIRRQRDLFEQRKQQKFVEKQRRKRNHRSDENQSDDRATYSVHSDVDEGVGVGAYSVDVTTAATWGGSTEQSSNEEDSAVGEEFPDNERNSEEDGDEYDGHFDQPEEEEEEEDGASNVPPIFKAKKYDDEQPRRGISWLNDVTPGKKRNSGDLYRGNAGSVSWSLDVSPPRSRRRLRQGNLTPAHKLIQDNKRKRQRVNQFDEEFSEASVTIPKPDEQLQTQLASMCTSLLRNEQTLLSMLRNQHGRDSTGLFSQPPVGNSQTLQEIEQFFERSTLNQSHQQTLDLLKTCYGRVEQHQLDMEYLKRQFESLNQRSDPMTADCRSPWPNPPSVHLSSFAGVNNDGEEEENRHEFSASIPSCLKVNPGFQRSTQTETTLFEDPFKTSIQPYTLFGETSLDACLSPNRKDRDDFTFEPVLDPVSPGAIGERNFSQQYEDQAIVTEPIIPFRLRMSSEYNPLSYQGGNFAVTSTGNVVTMSKMSLNKDRAETMVSDHAEKSIWPSFFKLEEASYGADNRADHSSKCSMTGHTDELTMRANASPAKTDDELAKGSAESNYSLFEALRDSIYSEVATLIAMNESRPHYLVELFRELQLLNSDYLRQRALYSLQELVTRFLTDDNVASSPAKSAFKQETVPTTTARAPYEDWIASASEQTPSESVMTTDDESEAQVLSTLARQIQNNDMYDYAELADTQSEGNLSTPTSQCDIPFAAEDLGNTVINLEEALEKMKMYEKNMAKVKKIFEQDSNASTPASSVNDRQDSVSAAYEEVKRRVAAHMETTSNSSAGDVTSEASSDMPQPSVDTQKLDRQIKSVMMDLIPFLNDHIESICNEELLDEVRHLIVQFAKRKEQFDESFHRQLDSILRDSLMKFHSRKLKECGEDMLVDVSEILFNELAFFRLMQDLNAPLYEGVSAADFQDQISKDGQHVRMPYISLAQDDVESSPAESVETVENEAVQVSSQSSSSSNAYVVIDPVDITDDETESSRQFVNVELSASESRPVRSSGSGEDDNEEEPSLFSKVSAPASSIHCYSQVRQANSLDNQQNGTADVARSSKSIEIEANLAEASQAVVNDIAGGQEQSDIVEDERDEGDQLAEEDHQIAQEDERSEHERVLAVNEQGNENSVGLENESAEDERNLVQGVEGQENEDSVEQDRVQQQELLNQNEAEEGDEDDLPEADMISEENIGAAQVVLAHLDGQEELAGDPEALPYVSDPN